MDILYTFASRLNRAQKRIIFVLLDVAAVFVTMAAAMMLNASTEVTPAALLSAMPLMVSMAFVGALFSIYIGIPHIKLNAYETRGIARTAAHAAVTAFTGLVLNGAVAPAVPIAVIVIFASLYLVVCASWRVLLRQYVLSLYRRGQNRMRVLIYGAGRTGQQLIAALRTDEAIQPVAFVDDNPTLQSMVIAGLPVHAPSKIKDLVAAKGVDRVVLAMPSLSQAKRTHIAHKLREMGCEVHALPSFAELIRDGEIAAKSAPVSLDQLLGRSRLESELPGVTHAYSGRRLLISGAGGSIGSELCRQLIACRPSCIVLLDHSELALYNIDKELRELSLNLPIVPVLGSVCDDVLMRRVLTEHNIDVVLHAAAYKHLPLVQCNPIAGLVNNVIGTKVIADAARDAGVERFILVSSDKAVRPTNVMGASKRLAEMVIQDLATRAVGTRFSMVRFGNVLGSSGSVIPLFEEQIARGGPVTLTHGSVTRYFMTISEAARLVLLAGSFARGGDVFVLDMGEPVPIKKLARQMIEGAGFTVKDEAHPEGDIEIKITGLRPGEKLHEELLISPDMLTTPHNKILRAQDSFLSEIEMATALKELRSAVELRDEEAAKKVISRWVEQSETEAEQATV